MLHLEEAKTSININNLLISMHVNFTSFFFYFLNYTHTYISREKKSFNEFHLKSTAPSKINYY